MAKSDSKNVIVRLEGGPLLGDGTFFFCPILQRCFRINLFLVVVIFFALFVTRTVLRYQWLPLRVEVREGHRYEQSEGWLSCRCRSNDTYNAS